MAKKAAEEEKSEYADYSEPIEKRVIPHDPDNDRPDPIREIEITYEGPTVSEQTTDDAEQEEPEGDEEDEGAEADAEDEAGEAVAEEESEASEEA